ncbi:MAG: hypothetical protein LC790_06575 [Actinobacteria bacterium]|nr:hypothetical protein [Actinomycetota bacterium]
MLERALAAPVTRVEHESLQNESWTLADEMAGRRPTTSRLARILGCRLVMLDARLRRGTARLGFVIGPTEV